jgi:hypothetical protein
MSGLDVLRARFASSRLILAAMGLMFSCIAPASTALAVTSVSPFVGSLVETWESRANYATPTFHFEPSPTTIMGGGASIAAPSMAIYEPPTNNFIIGGIPAQVSDGSKALGVDGQAALATVTFTSAVSEFGAFWGSGTPSNGVTVRFFDAGGTPIDTPIFFSYTRNGGFSGGDGGLDWHGWHSDTAIKSLTFSGAFVVVDGLRANPVPEPSSGVLLLAALCALALHGSGRRYVAPRCKRRARGFSMKIANRALAAALALGLPGSSAAVSLIGLNPVSSPPGVFATGPTHVLGIQTSPFSVAPMGTVQGEMLSGLGMQPGTGILFASSGNNGAHNGSLFRLDPTTGTATLIGSIGGIAAVPDIAFDSDGTLYGSGFDGLIRINPSTAAPTIVGLFGSSGGLTIRGLDGIAIHPLTGTMYGTSNNLFDGTPGDLFTINKTTGAATRVGQLKAGTQLLPNALAGLAFDPAGNLFGSLGGGDGRIISISVSTLSYSYLGDAAAGSVAALAFVPEPGTGTLLGLGLLGLAAVARRR